MQLAGHCLTFMPAADPRGAPILLAVAATQVHRKPSRQLHQLRLVDTVPASDCVELRAERTRRHVLEHVLRLAHAARPLLLKSVLPADFVHLCLRLFVATRGHDAHVGRPPGSRVRALLPGAPLHDALVLKLAPRALDEVLRDVLLEHVLDDHVTFVLREARRIGPVVSGGGSVSCVCSASEASDGTAGPGAR